MANPLNKNNKVEFDGLLVFAFVIIGLVIVISCGFFCYNNFLVESNQKNVIASYNNIVTSFRQDTHQAVVAITASDSVVLLDKNADKICKYELKDNNLVRFDKNDNMSTVFKSIESLCFSTNEKQPNLLTVRVFPADKKEIPFFTSFALRGLNNDMQ